MKKKCVFLALVFFLILLFSSCTTGKVAEKKDESPRNISEKTAEIEPNTDNDINPFFASPPPVDGHDAEWAFDPTDIFSFNIDWKEDAAVLENAHISVFCPGFFGYSEANKPMDENTIEELSAMGIRMVDWLSTFDLQEEPFVQFSIFTGKHHMAINCQGNPPEFFLFKDDLRIKNLPADMTTALGDCLECAVPISIFDGEEKISISITSAQNNYPVFTKSDIIDDVLEIYIGSPKD